MGALASWVVLAMALGSGETTVFKLTAAYATFVNGGKPLARHRTSSAGEATLRGRAGETKTIYVIPPHGSFAVAHVPPCDWQSEQVPVASQLLLTQSESSRHGKRSRQTGHRLPPQSVPVSVPLRTNFQ